MTKAYHIDRTDVTKALGEERGKVKLSEDKSYVIDENGNRADISVWGVGKQSQKVTEVTA